MLRTNHKFSPLYITVCCTADTRVVVTYKMFSRLVKDNISTADITYIPVYIVLYTNFNTSLIAFNLHLF